MDALAGLFVAALPIIWMCLVCGRLGVIMKTNQQIVQELKEIKYMNMK